MSNFPERGEDWPSERGEEEPSYQPFPWEDPGQSARFQVLEPEEPLSEPWSAEGEGPGPEGPTAAGRLPLPPELAELVAQARGEEAARARPRRRWLTWLRELAETALLALLIFLAVRASFQNFRVEGASMLPSLEDGQYLIVNKLAYATVDLKIFDWVPFFDPGEDSVHHLFGAPGRGDVIIFQSVQNPQRDFIKRIIAVPGDQVELREGKVFLNGEELVEPYAQGPTTCGGQWCSLSVAEDHFYVLGDNRPSSSDSRAFGLVPEEFIVGKAFFSYWPLRDAGLAPNHAISYAKDEAATGE